MHLLYNWVLRYLDSSFKNAQTMENIPLKVTQKLLYHYKITAKYSANFYCDKLQGSWWWYLGCHAGSGKQLVGRHGHGPQISDIWYFIGLQLSNFTVTAFSGPPSSSPFVLSRPGIKSEKLNLLTLTYFSTYILWSW